MARQEEDARRVAAGVWYDEGRKILLVDPALCWEWSGESSLTMQDYVRVLESAYDVMRQAEPDARINQLVLLTPESGLCRSCWRNYRTTGRRTSCYKGGCK